MKLYTFITHTKKFILFTAVFSCLPSVSLAQGELIKGLSEARALSSAEKQLEFLRAQNPGVELAALEKTVQYLRHNPNATETALSQILQQKTAAAELLNVAPASAPASLSVAAPALKRPAEAVTLQDKQTDAIKDITLKLTRVPVPGYGTYFIHIKRSDFLAMERYGLHLQRIVDMYQKIYPHNSTTAAPNEFTNIIQQVKKADDIMLHNKGAIGWWELRGQAKQVFFESGLPGELIEPTEELVIPSFTQMDVAQTYWLDIANGNVEKTMYAENSFGQYTSAATNLGLFGSPDTAQAIIKMAKRDYGLFDLWKDYFFTRALLNLGAYKELQELAQFRLSEIDSNRDPKQLAAVWRGVQAIAPKTKYRLNIPDNRIADHDAPAPELLQKELLLHHPFAYVLLNGSQEVTVLWQNLRHRLDENFTHAALQAGVGTMLAAQIIPEPVKPKYVPPAPHVEYDEPEEEIIEEPSDEDIVYTVQERITPVRTLVVPKTKVKPTPVKKVRTPAQVREELEMYLQDNNGQLPPNPHTLRTLVYKTFKQEDAANPEVIALHNLWNSHLKGRWYNSKGRTITRTPANVRQELETYMQENHGNLPKAGVALRAAAYKISTTGDPNDPDVQVITRLLNIQKRQPSLHKTAAEVYAELRAYFATNTNLPPNATPLSNAAYFQMKKGNQNDPHVQAIHRLWQQHVRRTQPITRTPQQVRGELETYLQENNNQFPPKNSALYQAINRLMQKPVSDDPDEQIIRTLWNAHFKPREVSHHYDEIREELEEYIDVHGGLPPTNSSLRKRAKYVRETGEPNNEDVQAVTELLAGHRQKKPRTPDVVRAELENYIQANGQLPLSNTPIRRRAEDIKANGNPDNPDVQAITTLLNEKALHVKRDPASLRRDLEMYLTEHDGQYPANGTPLNRAIQRVLKQNPTDENEDIKEVRLLWNKHLTELRNASRQRITTQNNTGKMTRRTAATRQHRTPKEVREQLEQYIQEHDGQLPPDAHPLRSAAYKMKERGNPQDEDVITITALLQKHKQRNGALPDPAKVLRELQAYFAENTFLPSGNIQLSKNVYTLLRAGDKTDKQVQDIAALWNSHKQDRSTPTAPVRAELEQYLAEHDGQIPPYKHPVRVRAEYRIQTGNPNDPDIIFMKDVLETQKQTRTKRTPEQVRTELESYLKEHDNQLPPHASALDQAIQRVIKREPEHPDSQVIFSLLKARQKRPNTQTPQDRSPKQLRADLEAYFNEHETLTGNRALYQALNKALKNADPNDPDIQAIQKLWDTHRQHEKRTPQSVYEDVQSYFKEHAHLPNDLRALHSAALRIMKEGNENDPYVQALKNFWQEKKEQTHRFNHKKDTH